MDMFDSRFVYCYYLRIDDSIATQVQGTQLGQNLPKIWLVGARQCQLRGCLCASQAPTILSHHSILSPHLLPFCAHMYLCISSASKDIWTGTNLKIQLQWAAPSSISKTEA